MSAATIPAKKIARNGNETPDFKILKNERDKINPQLAIPRSGIKRLSLAFVTCVVVM